MAKKDESLDTEFTEEYYDEQPASDDYSQAVAAEGKQALQLFEEADDILDLSALLDAAGFNAPKIPIAERSGKPFVIRWFNSFPSSFQDGKNAYFCICRDWETGDLFSTVIGFDRACEILERLEQQGIRSGIKMCVELQTGKGKFGRYYVLK